MKYEKELNTALRAVSKAAELCTAVQKSLTEDESLSKKDRSPVTIADFGSQALINLALMQEFPDDSVVSEEDSGVLRAQPASAMREKVVSIVLEITRESTKELTAEQVLDAIDHGKPKGSSPTRYWAVDPVDGTKGFMRGEQYAVALALIEGGEVVLGVLGCPNMGTSLLADEDHSQGTIFYAVKGSGAFSSPLGQDAREKIRVSNVSDTHEARFVESVESGHSSHSDSEAVADKLGVKNPPIRLDGQGKYAALARGEASVYLRLPVKKGYAEKIWDHAAGWIIIKEAGGEVTDVLGNPVDFSRVDPNVGELSVTGIIATNRALHDRVLKVVRDVVVSRVGSFL